ncbi:DUF2489 domain-containing protein [Shewanella sp. 202IG2-18]|uniref:DUF2489 domain-containing protein n=1 Tax=Parashewanella hymeniacidonis TaxID=2807618 RepID=UPI00195F7C33|nr:DUF2489 domain-containing protein [Parashewanella hymeniacidonis]MBM7072571.1 DUF2489 domain-containing protein [Parashewanella hymeniacidonis]
MVTALFIVGFIIIVSLTAYATKLMLQLRKQTQAKEQLKQQKHEQAKAKKESILEDVRYIAAAMLEDRCELSEGVVRIARLFEVISLTEQVNVRYPMLYQHFEVIRKHPIMEHRKALQKRERMQLDMQRMKSEAALEAEILKEAESLQHFKLETVLH